MKFIFSFFTYIMFMSVAFSASQNKCELKSVAPSCHSVGGCEWVLTEIDDEVIGSCEICQPNYYNPQHNASGCLICNDSVFEPNSHKIADTQQTEGQSSCPWVCNDGYFDDTEHTQCLFCPTNTSGFMSYPNGEAPTSNCANSCSGGKYIIDTLESANSTSHRYYCGTCGLGTQSSNGVVSTCTCYNAPGVNRVYGGGPNRTTNRIECECTAGATWQDNACKCGVNTYLTQTDNGYICQSCPGHALTSAIGATSFDECLCEAGYYMSGNTCKSCPEHASCSYAGKTYENVQCASGYQKIPDPDTQTFICRSCSDEHATLDDNTNACLCKPGYYGAPIGLQTSCTQCPIGMTTNPTDLAQHTDISACHMTHNTKFCIAGQSNSCVNFIPFGATIYPQN